jgi:hypothetical protein
VFDNVQQNSDNFFSSNKSYVFYTKQNVRWASIYVLLIHNSKVWLVGAL